MASLLPTGCLVLFCILAPGIMAMDCSLGTSENAFEEFINTCPRPILDTSSEHYCCYSFNSEGKTTVRCCNLWDYIVSSVTNILLPLIIIVLVVSLLISCICCLCCRRSRGGRVLQPALVDTLPAYVTLPAGYSISSQPLLRGVY